MEEIRHRLAAIEHQMKELRIKIEDAQNLHAEIAEKLRGFRDLQSHTLSQVVDNTTSILALVKDMHKP